MKEVMEQYIKQQGHRFACQLMLIICLLVCISTTVSSQEASPSIVTTPSSAQAANNFLETTLVNEALLLAIDKKAIQFIEQGELLNARQTINTAIDDTDFSLNPRSLINRLMIRAALDRMVGANISALQDLQFAFRLAASTNHQDLVSDVSYNIASIHQERNEHSIALSYATQAIEKYKIAGAMNKLEKSLMLSISSLLATQQNEMAKLYLEQVKPIMLDSEDLMQQTLYFQYLGESLLLEGKLDESLANLETAVKVVPQNEPKQYYSKLSTLHLLISRVHTNKNEMDLAIDNLIKAFNFANNGQSSFYLHQALQLHRAELLSQLDEFEAAFRVTKSVLEQRDLNQPIAEVKRMLDMHANFQLELQQQENSELKELNKWQNMQIENKQLFNRLYFVVTALLVLVSLLLLALFLRGRKHSRHLEKIAHTDALTGLHSRSRVLALLEYHQDLFARNKHSLCVAIVDLDHFKRINDTYGHQTGDKVLKQFGEVCVTSFRKTDIIGRIGGEEFLFVLPNTTISKAVDVFKQFNQKLPAISEALDLKQNTTASIGLVSPIPGEPPMNIVKRADDALYEAKNTGRNRVVTGNNLSSLQNQKAALN